MNHNRKILPNGLRLITVPMPSFESVTVMVMVGAGSRYETTQNNGISHFLEHMAFKGTKSRPSAMSIASLIDGIGGEFNAFTGKETTGYYVKSSATHTGLCLDLLSDMLQNSLLDSVEIEKEKGVIIEEINMYEDTPMRKIGDIYEELLYGDTPMGWDTAGTKKVIRGAKREDFVSYMQSLYSAQNMTVVVAGGIDSQKAEELVNKYFTKMSRFNTLVSSKVIDSQKNSGVLVREKKTEQVHLAIGFRTVGINHKDKYPLELLAAILGGGMSSRLFEEVREKRGLAYYVRTSSDNYTDCGTLVTNAGVDAARIDDAIKVILQEYKKISNGEKVVAEEVKKAKEFLKGHFVLELEDSRSVAGFYATQELLEKQIDNPEDIIKKIDAITPEMVSSVAHKYFLQNTLNLSVIGNFADRQRFQDLLKL